MYNIKGSKEFCKLNKAFIFKVAIDWFFFFLSFYTHFAYLQVCCEIFSLQIFSSCYSFSFSYFSSLRPRYLKENLRQNLLILLIDGEYIYKIIVYFIWSTVFKVCHYIHIKKEAYLPPFFIGPSSASVHYLFQMQKESLWLMYWTATS